MTLNQIALYVELIGHSLDMARERGLPAGRIQVVHELLPDRSADAEPGFELDLDPETLHLKCIFIHVRPDVAGTPVYQGELPFDLERNMSRQEVLDVSGTPTSSRAAGRIPILGLDGGFDRFKLNHEVEMTVYYTTEGEIMTVTLSSPSTGQTQ